MRHRRQRETLQAVRLPEANPNVAFDQHLSFNDRPAILATRAFGSMPTFYLFLVWSCVIPALFPTLRTVVFYVSSAVIQLVALPLISVGTNLLGRHSEARAEADFAVNQKSLTDLERLLGEQDRLLQEVSSWREDR